jgi:hypothetical protein
MARSAHWIIGVLLGAVLALPGCAPTPERAPPTPERERPADYPLDVYREALQQGRAVYRIAGDQSEIVIRLYRGGSLARLGHNHTVASRDIAGYAIAGDDVEGARVDLYFPVARVIVDDPADRAGAGEDFDKPLSEEAVEGTRENMLGEGQLHAADHPFISVAGRVVSVRAPRPEVELTFYVRGRTATRRLAMDLEQQGDRLIASGVVDLRLTELGIEPYSVLGGALKVQDEIDLEFEIVAERIERWARKGTGLPVARARGI